MGRPARLAAGAVLASAILVGACGDDDGTSTSTPATSTSEGARTIPQELLGAWTVKLRESDFEDPKIAEREAGSSHTLKFALTGAATDGGPAVTLTNDDERGQIESPEADVRGDELVLTEQFCGVDKSFGESRYRWSVAGGRLTLETIENGCSDGVAEAVYTGRPWTRRP